MNFSNYPTAAGQIQALLPEPHMMGESHRSHEICEANDSGVDVAKLAASMRDNAEALMALYQSK